MAVPLKLTAQEVPPVAILEVSDWEGNLSLRLAELRKGIRSYCRGRQILDLDPIASGAARIRLHLKP